MERLLVQGGGLLGPVPLPCRDEGVMLVVAQRLAFGRLVLLAEMAAARLVARQRIAAHELRELEEIRHPPGALEVLVDLPGVARDPQVAPELRAQRGDLADRALQSRGVARDAAA